MRHASSTHQNHRSTTLPKAHFNLFIACEDQAACARARKIEEEVEALCRPHAEVARTFWSFSLMRHDGLRQFAVQEAAGADMIVVSLRADAELPAHVKAWLENLPASARAGKVALVALLGHQFPWEALNHNIAYLRQIAESRGLNFFCNQAAWWHPSFSKRAFRRLEVRRPEEEGVLFHPVPIWAPADNLSN